MVGHEVRDPAANVAVVIAACGSPQPPSAKRTSSPSAELGLTLTEGLLLPGRGGDLVPRL